MSREEKQEYFWLYGLCKCLNRRVANIAMTVLGLPFFCTYYFQLSLCITWPSLSVPDCLSKNELIPYSLGRNFINLLKLQGRRRWKGQLLWRDEILKRLRITDVNAMPAT